MVTKALSWQHDAPVGMALARGLSNEEEGVSIRMGPDWTGVDLMTSGVPNISTELTTWKLILGCSYCKETKWKCVENTDYFPGRQNGDVNIHSSIGTN